MKNLGALVKRNIKLFFKDRALFFVAMISPMVLLVLFVSFLGSVYKGTFTDIFTSMGVSVEEGLLSGAVMTYLVASLLSVSCVTVAFCCNVMSIQDKINGVAEDFKATPVKKATLAMSYFVATFLVSVLICLIILGLALVVLAMMGQFNFSFGEVMLSVLDVVILSLFGTVLSSIICHFCSSQAQMGAITGIISSCYGFLCGAYMPISQFAAGIRGIISVLPGTFGTSLLKNHLLSGSLAKMAEGGVPGEAVDGIRSAFDLKLEAFGGNIEQTTMYLVLMIAIVVLSVVFVVLSTRKKK